MKLVSAHGQAWHTARAAQLLVTIAITQTQNNCFVWCQSHLYTLLCLPHIRCGGGLQFTVPSTILIVEPSTEEMIDTRQDQ